MKALITRKLGMTSIIREDGTAVGVTLLSTSPNTVTQVKTPETDGYSALQVGFEIAKKVTKPLAGHFAKSKAMPKVTREFRIDNETNELNIGDTISADIFEVGDKISATGITKGKGFAGTIKRHNFHRGRKTHGGRSYRRPGSIGSQYPQRIFPGKKMAGQMGHDQVTTKNLKVAVIDTELGIIGIEGSVPGPRKGLVLIKTVKS